MAEEVQKLLEHFAKSFVEKFEDKTKECKGKAAVEGKPKTGKKTGAVKDALSLAGNAAGVVSGVPGGSAIGKSTGGKIVDLVYKNTAGKKSRAKAMAVYEALRKIEGDEVRKILVEGSCEIFRVFECQFMNVTDKEDSHHRGLEKLAADAVDIIMNYINEHDDEEFSSEFLTKGVVLGKSKSRLNQFGIMKNGYAIKLKGESLQTSVLYEMQGRVTVTTDGDCDKYYVRHRCDDVRRFGFRLLFPLEQLDKDHEEQNIPSVWKYEYELNREDMDEEATAILEQIERKDKDKVPEKVHETNVIVKEINKTSTESNEMIKENNEITKESYEMIKENAEICTQIYNKVATINQPIIDLSGEFYFDIRPPILSFTGRNEELNKLHEALQNKGQTVISQMVSVSGLGGIGKSELARKYVEEFGKEYDKRIIWINAETYASLTSSFKRLCADGLGISLKNIDGEQKDIKSIVQEVYKDFANKICLFVFDNAEKRMNKHEGDAGIDQFLPSSTLYLKQCFVLITSRNRAWGKIRILNLDVFTKDEALEFIRKYLIIEEGLQETQIADLAETLQYFPLALQQTVSYIKEIDGINKNLGLKYTIQNYLIEFKYKTKSLLDHKFPEGSDDIYMKTVFTTWKITIDKISENAQYGKQAKEILDMIAYFAPDNIPVEIFMHLEMTEDDKRNLSYAIELLKQYSMITAGQDGSFNVHRLVQTVTRLDLEEQQKHCEIVNRISQSVKKNNINNPQMDEIQKIRKIYSHFEAFLAHLHQATETSKDVEKNVNIILNILIILNKVYCILGEYKKIIQLSVRTLQMVDKYFTIKDIDITDILAIICVSADNYTNDITTIGKQYYLDGKDKAADIAIVMNIVALAIGHLGDYGKEKILLERVLSIQEKHYGAEHITLATTLSNLGLAEGKLGDYNKQKTLQERAFTIKERHYGPEHITLATTLNNLGLAEGMLGDHNKEKTLQERALTIQEKHYGAEHITNATILNNLGLAEGMLGDYDKQKMFQERALTIQERHYGPEHITLAATLNNLGLAEGKLGDFNKEKILLERALSIKEKHYGPDHTSIATTLSIFG